MFNHSCEHCWGKYFKLLEKQKLESCLKQENKETEETDSKDRKRWITVTSSANKITVLRSMKQYNQLIISRYLHLNTWHWKIFYLFLILILFKLKVFWLINGNLLKPSIYLIFKGMWCLMYKRRLQPWPPLQKWYIFLLFNYLPAMIYIFFLLKLCLIYLMLIP